MGQELLFLEDSYVKECAASVAGVQNGRYVFLDRVLFYPEGGGQPHDTGELIRDGNGNAFKVTGVRKRDGIVWVEIEGTGLAQDDGVKCILNWERRYALMRMHSAAHVLASFFYKMGGAKITGNQLGTDRGRFDFSMPSFDREKMVGFVDAANSAISKCIGIKTYTLPYDEAMKNSEIVKLAGALPPHLKELRIVEVPGVDVQADGGTHVRNTREIGKIEIVGLENKGRDSKRLYFRLTDSI